MYKIVEWKRETRNGKEIYTEGDTGSSVDCFFFVLLSRGWYKANSKHFIISASSGFFSRDWYRANSIYLIISASICCITSGPSVGSFVLLSVTGWKIFCRYIIFHAILGVTFPSGILLWCWEKKDTGNTNKVDRKTYIFK